MRGTSRAAQLAAGIVQVRTQQLELRLRAGRRGGALSGERLYRSGELDALLADLRAELRAAEWPDVPWPAAPRLEGGAQGGPAEAAY